MPSPSDSWLLITRTVRFGDTDAAGVMHFQQLLRWCHEAYEQSLEGFGISSAEIFPRPGLNLTLLLPIVHCSADFFAPLVCGDALEIQLQPRQLDPCAFEVNYLFSSDGVTAARALTRHVCLGAEQRRRAPLPEPIGRWLELSGLQQGVRPL